MKEGYNKSVAIITREGHSVGKTEEYHRSNHNDFATGKELVDRNFSGIRNNSIALTTEIWLDGNMVASMNQKLAAVRPDLWNKLYQDVFGLTEVASVNENGSIT